MNTACHILHERLSELPRLDFSYQKNDIPPDGIYIMFENGETAHNTDRIVRIGINTASKNLPKRLKDHFHRSKKDSSVLRRHIGKAILNERDDPFFENWKIKRSKIGENNIARLEQIEQEVSLHITNNLTFSVIPILSKSERLYIESALLTTINNCSHCKPTKKWLGVYHPRSKISDSGLWNIQGLNKTPLSPEEAQALVIR